MRAHLLLLFLVVVSALAVPPRASGLDPVAIVIEGPTAIGVSSTHAYTVTVTGGPGAEGGQFEIRAVLQGTNLAGADPVVDRIFSNERGVFTVNVTAPQEEASIQLYVRARSFNATTNATKETRLQIEVARPLELRATIRNTGPTAALNVTVYFYVDGRLVGNTTLARIDAGGQTDANVTYIPAGLAPGRHVVKIWADLDGDGSEDPGELVDQDFFYRSTASNVPAILGTITVFLIVILVFVLLAIRRQRRQGG